MKMSKESIQNPCQHLKAVTPYQYYQMILKPESLTSIRAQIMVTIFVLELALKKAKTYHLITASNVFKS